MQYSTLPLLTTGLRRAAFLLPVVLLAACAAQTTYRQDVRGIPVTGAPLTTDPPFVLEKLVPLLSITSGCKETPKSVAVALIGKSDDVRMNAAGTPVSGYAREVWNFAACATTIPMYVTYSFMPDGKVAYTFAAK